MSSSTKRPTAQTFASFADFLASTLGVGTKLRVYHVSTPAVPVPPIFAAAPGHSDEPTTCETHFLTIAQQHSSSHNDAEDDKSRPSQVEDAVGNDHILVLGVEVLVFSTASLTTIFVSKADSTGFLLKTVTQRRGASSIAHTVIAAFLEWLVAQNLSTKISDTASAVKQGSAPPQTIHDSTIEHQLPDSALADRWTESKRKKLVLALFARSQNQYLFPGSVENKTKHVLDDRQLIKWWCKVLNELVQKDWPFALNLSHNDKGSLPVLARSSTGVSAHETYLGPRSTSSITPEAFVVVPGCDRTEVIRAFLPGSAHIPSDAGKARWHNQYPVEFLTGQDLESASSEFLVRCSIPRFPDDPKARFCNDLDGAGVDDTGRWKDVRTLQQFWETMEYRQECAAGRLVGFIWVTFDTYGSHEAKHQGVSEAIDAAPAQTDTGYLESTDVRLPPTDRASSSVTVLTADQYVELSDLLINDSDFEGVEQAAKSTHDWIVKVKELAGIADVGKDIEGRAPENLDNSNNTHPLSRATNGGHVQGTTAEPKVNILTVKKRKRNAEDTSEHKILAEPKVLAASLVRKKSKLEL